MLFIVNGNLLDYEHKVDVIVNAWNRNFIPHSLLITHGVSKAIKAKSGKEPFKEVKKKGMLKLGEGVLTSSGNLSCKGIIHVAGIDIFWNSSLKAVELSAKSIDKIIRENNFKSVAIPLIGCGADKLNEEDCINILAKELEYLSHDVDVYIVKYTGEEE